MAEQLTDKKMPKGLRRQQDRVEAQKINKQENRLYYQNGTEQKTARSEAKRNSDRKLEK